MNLIKSMFIFSISAKALSVLDLSESGSNGVPTNLNKLLYSHDKHGCKFTPQSASSFPSGNKASHL